MTTNATRQISNSDDIIDSRDVIARIEELESERESLVEQAEESRAAGDGSDSILADIEAIDEELKPLRALADEAADYAPDWKHGEALIRDSHFEDYAQELAEDTGMVNKAATWPNCCIDWTQAAEMLQQDYTSVDFDGVTYWIRS